MKAVRVENGQPTVVTVDAPRGDGVLVDVVSASICGSDFHLIAMGAVEGRIIGHEFAGTTPDGTAVAVEPTIGCGVCDSCADGERRDCQVEKSFLGISSDGGMAEQVLVDPMNLVELPSGLDVGIAALVEPLAVAAHVLRRVGLQPGERVAVIGAGPIGLAVTAMLRDRGVVPVLFARHDHQKAAGQALGASLTGDDGFDVIIDAVGTTASIDEGVTRIKPRGRIGLAGTLWQPASLNLALWSKEVSIIPAAGLFRHHPRPRFRCGRSRVGRVSRDRRRSDHTPLPARCGRRRIRRRSRPGRWRDQGPVRGLILTLWPSLVDVGARHVAASNGVEDLQGSGLRPQIHTVVASVHANCRLPLMASTTTIRIDGDTHAQLLELSRAADDTLVDTVRAAAEALRRQRFGHQVAKELDELAKDPGGWAAYLAEADRTAVRDGIG